MAKNSPLKREAEGVSHDDAIIRPRSLTKRLDVSLATLWRWRRKGILPEPLHLSSGVIGWKTSVIDTWLASRTESTTGNNSSSFR